ncbi:helix-turn-helix domain-containing protein [Streptomyces caniscabiei]|nr:helix-turn-helix domain-containing protein [Streptomyces caniscabiei]MDX3507794.1 helix-turn-helix domain-containing protein [Streptomyces caniscabiei]MDX3717756.1 helix-turn-helix domain-containing protein [Streptomyces caniscabiei]
MSARHLSRVFRDSGVTPARYILDRRLARAREQLADPGSRHLTVAEIPTAGVSRARPTSPASSAPTTAGPPGETRPPRAPARHADG